MNNSPLSGITDDDTAGPLVSTPSGLLAFSGRIGRMKFFWVQAVTFCVVMVVGVVLSVIPPANLNFSLVIASALPPACIALYLSFVAGVKRCHDLDKSGWLYLLLVIPVVGSIFSLYLLFAKGTEQNNKYGISLHPKAATPGRSFPPTRAVAAASEGLIHSEVSSSSFSPSSSQVSPFVKPIVAASSTPSEDMWAAAIAEFDSDARRPGLWALSFSESQGDEGAAKANYLRYRTDELQYENATALDQQVINSMKMITAIADKNDLPSGSILVPVGGLSGSQTIFLVAGALILAALMFLVFRAEAKSKYQNLQENPAIASVDVPLPTVSQMPDPPNSSDADSALKISDGKDTKKLSEPECIPRSHIAKARQLYPLLEGLDDDSVIDFLQEGLFRGLPREHVAKVLCAKPFVPAN